MKLKDIKRAIKLAKQHYATYWQPNQEIYFELNKVEYDYEMNEEDGEAPFVTVKFGWGNESKELYHTGQVTIYEWCNTPERLAAYMMGVAQEIEMKGE